jgi:hypothetical protein
MGRETYVSPRIPYLTLGVRELGAQAASLMCAKSAISVRRSQINVLHDQALLARPDYVLEDRGGTLLGSVGCPYRSIITIPISLYRSGNGDDAKQTGDQPAEGRCTPAPRKPPQMTVMSVMTVMIATKLLI